MGVEEFGQHDVNRRRAGIATGGQIAEPAFARDGEVGLGEQVFDHRHEALRGIVTEEVVNFFRGDPAFAHQLDVFVDGNVEQMRQQADVLANGQRPCSLGFRRRRKVEEGGFAIFAQAQLHADRVVAGETFLVYPFELEAQAIATAGRAR